MQTSEQQYYAQQLTNHSVWFYLIQDQKIYLSPNFYDY